MSERDSLGSRAVEVLWETLIGWNSDLMSVDGVGLQEDPPDKGALDQGEKSVAKSDSDVDVSPTTLLLHSSLCISSTPLSPATASYTPTPRNAQRHRRHNSRPNRELPAVSRYCDCSSSYTLISTRCTTCPPLRIVRRAAPFALAQLYAPPYRELLYDETAHALSTVCTAVERAFGRPAGLCLWSARRTCAAFRGYAS